MVKKRKIVEPSDNIPISISRRFLYTFVHAKVKNISYAHVRSIILILFEEILKDLSAGKKIKIGNFGELVLKQMPARSFHNVALRKRMMTEGRKVLRFFVQEDFKKRICDLLDLDRTLESNDTEK